MAKVKKAAIKIIKKKWVSLYASPEFNKEKLGETYIIEAKDAIGKHVKANLMSLTHDPKKQNLSVSFLANHVEGEGLVCRVVGYEMSPVSIKKIVRRNRIKINDSFILSTGDEKTIRIKPLFLTKGMASRSIATELRKQARAFLAISLKKMTYSQFISEVISRRLHKRLSDILKKVYPLAICEIRKFALIETKDLSEKTEEAEQAPATEPEKKQAEATA